MMLSTVSSKPPAAFTVLLFFAPAGAGAPARPAVATTSVSAARPGQRRSEMCIEKYTIGVNRSSPQTVYSSEPPPTHSFWMEPSVMRLYQLFCARNAAIAAALSMSAVSVSGQQLSASGQPVSLSLAVQTAAQATTLQPGGTVRRISIDEAVKLAMEQNLGIKIQRFDPEIQDAGVSLARSNWAPVLSSTISRNSNQQPTTSILSGTQPSVATGTFAAGVSLNQQLPWHGANYALNWNNSRFTTNDPTNTFNPRVSSNMSFQFQQP